MRDAPHAAIPTWRSRARSSSSPTRGGRRPACTRRRSSATDVTLGADVSIGAVRRHRRRRAHRRPRRSCTRTWSSAGEVEIGDDCVLHAHVSIRERVRLGDRVDPPGRRRHRQRRLRLRAPRRRHASQDSAGRRRRHRRRRRDRRATPPIDRPAVGETRIGAGTKIDNLVQIAHGVTIGRNVLLAAQVGIAGSTTLEDDVMLAGQVGRGRTHHDRRRASIATAQTGDPELGRGRRVRLGISRPSPTATGCERRRSSASCRSCKKLVADLERRDLGRARRICHNRSSHAIRP